MPEPTVAIVRDQNGAVHFSASTSPFVQKGLANGSLTEVKEATDGATDASPSDGDNPGKRRGGSHNRSAAGGTGNGDDDTGVA